MSVHVLSWVLRNSEAQLGARLVLLSLADHAKDDGTFAWPSVETMGREARLSRSAVQRNLRQLKVDGAIVERGRSQAGTMIYDVVMGGPQNAAGAALRRKGGRTARPEPSKEPSTGGSARARQLYSTINGDGRTVLKALGAVAEARGLPDAWSPDRALAHCEMFPDRAHAAEAEAFRFYYVEGAGENRPVKDVVARWRNWLDRAPSASKRQVQRNGRASAKSARTARRLASVRGDGQ